MSTADTALPPERRVRVHIVRGGDMVNRAAAAAQGVDLMAGLDDAEWVWALDDGDVPTDDACGALAALPPIGPGAPHLVAFGAIRRGADGRVWPAAQADLRNPAYAIATSALLSMSVLVWRADAWREACAPDGAAPHARLGAMRLIENGARIAARPEAVAVRRAHFAGAETARPDLDAALAVTAAIAAGGDEQRRWPHGVLMTTAEVAGAAIAAGLYTDDLLAGFSALPAAPINDAELAHRVLEGMRAGAAAPIDDLAAARPDLRAQIDHFFDEIIAIGAPHRACDAARWRVLRRVVGAVPPAETLTVTPVEIDVSKPLAPIKGVGPQTLLARVHHEGEELDWIQLPTIDGAAAADLRIVLKDALARQPTWRIGQLAGVRQGAEFYGSLAVASAKAAPDAALAAVKGEAGRVALAHLRTKIVREAQMDRIAALRAKRMKGRRKAPERPILPPIGAATTVPVLMYHEVTPLASGASRFAAPLETFEAHLRWLAANGYQSLAAIEWANAIREGRPVPEKSVVITFDDAYLDFADHAWPALRRNGFYASLFVPAQFVGKAPAWRGAPKGQRLLDYTALRALSDDGCEIGSHAMSHRHLSTLGPEDMLEEAFESKKILEDFIGQPVETVAYPFGDSDTAVRSAFLMAGFRGGFTAWGGASTLEDDPMSIARIEVRGDWDVETFAAHVTAHSAAVASRWAS
ncbi:MAG: polysaccharide deacetylase family protein [Alphaproteobacteria bacterium]|nr:polysaccharide deacetylase family protein [Alphaproteobacteria bacterium]